MKTVVICPISNKKIDEHVARITATFTLIFLLVFFLTLNIFVVGFLFVDFLLRSIELSKYSPLASVSRYLVMVLGLKSKPINAGPKVFASRIGLFFSATIFFSALFGLTIVPLSFSIVFGVCALLEASIGFCLACEIYPYVFRITSQLKSEV